ncbi:hypothetical protein A9Q99_01225 [Gammaproteobacteria bacterium 45_16_T64]|nr:hypothetical protein A9Q99_01225 [Gammaproteobacteria bacterium 45_16_T64]
MWKALVMGSALVLSTISSTVCADPVDNLVEKAVRNNGLAKNSQQKIDKLSDATQQLFSSYQLESKRIEDLNIYNLQLKQQIYDQNVKIIELSQSLEDISLIERQISPLLLRMIQSLEQFIDLDVPFLLEERHERIKFLRKAMERADVSSAEKFRQVLEAYNIENEYGTTIESYKGSVQLGDRSQEVDFLRVGRVALLFQTLDGKRQGSWNQKQQQWEELDDRYRRDIRLGLKMAQKQTAPNLIKIPVPTPAGVKK